MSARAWGWMISMLVLLLAPRAIAWQTTMTVDALEPADGVVKPEVEFGLAMATLEVLCEAGDVQADATVNVKWEAQVQDVAAAWTRVVLLGSEAPGVLSCAGGASGTRFYTNVTVTFNRGAPAYAAATTVVSADVTVQQSPLPSETQNASQEVSFKVDYLPRMTYEPVAYTVRTEPGKEGVFRIRMTNLGNGPTLVVTDVRQPENTKNRLEWVTSPLNVTVLSKAQDATNRNTAEALIRFMAPDTGSYQNKYYHVAAYWVARHDNLGVADSAEDRQSFSLSVQVEGGGPVDVPGPAIMPALFLSLLLYWALRRRSP